MWSDTRRRRSGGGKITRRDSGKVERKIIMREIRREDSEKNVMKDAMR